MRSASASASASQAFINRWLWLWHRAHCESHTTQSKQRKSLSGYRRRTLRGRSRLKKYTFSTLSVMLILAFNNYAPEVVTRFFPRTLRELRRASVNWKYQLRCAQHEPKFVLHSATFKIYVLSLKRYPRNQTIHSLQHQGISFEVYPAVDGLEDFDRQKVQTFAGRNKRRWLRMTSEMSSEELLELNERYKAGMLKSKRLRAALHERLRFGCYLSHVLVWQNMLHLGHSFSMVLEDDIVLNENFMESVASLLQKLPRDWGLLYLNGSHQKFGYRFDDGLTQSRGGVGAFGYLISQNTANKFLHGPALRSDRAIDLMMNEEVLSGRILAFHATPPLVQTIPSMPSSLAYERKQ